MAESDHVAASGIPQRGHEQMHSGLVPPDFHGRLAEVDLQLLAGRRLETDRGLGPGPEFGPQALTIPLYRAKAGDQTMVSGSVLSSSF